MNVLGNSLSRSDINNNRWLLNELTLLGSGKSKKKVILRDYGFTPIGFDSLKDLYWQLVVTLNQKHFLETTRTLSEKRIEIYLKEKRVRFLRSVWLGGHNVDFYLPNYRLILEINGGVHDLEFKMKKDIHRDRVIMGRLGLFSMEILNEDVSSVGPGLSRFLSNKGNRANSNIVKNNWRRIYIETLCRFISHEQIEQRFGGDPNGALQELYARGAIK